MVSVIIPLASVHVDLRTLERTVLIKIAPRVALEMANAIGSQGSAFATMVGGWQIALNGDVPKIARVVELAILALVSVLALSTPGEKGARETVLANARFVEHATRSQANVSAPDSSLARNVRRQNVLQTALGRDCVICTLASAVVHLVSQMRIVARKDACMIAMVEGPVLGMQQSRGASACHLSLEAHAT